MPGDRRLLEIYLGFPYLKSEHIRSPGRMLRPTASWTTATTQVCAGVIDYLYDQFRVDEYYRYRHLHLV